MGLNQLTITSDKRPVALFKRDGLERAKAALLASIEMQHLLIQEERTGIKQNLTKSVRKIDSDGNKITITKDRKPRRWFFKRSDGVYVFEIIFSNKPIPLNKNGQTVIEGGDLDGLERALAVVKKAVEDSELDAALKEINNKRKSKKRAAA